MSNVYWIVPAASKVYWFVVPVVLILVGVIGLMALTTMGSQKSRIEVHADHIRIRGDLYGRAIPLTDVRIDEARVIDLRGEPGFRPASRRMGTGMPGYSAGWFRLRNGEKALVYVTDATRVVYLPTTRGYSVVMSLLRPDEMVAELKRVAP